MSYILGSSNRRFLFCLLLLIKTALFTTNIEFRVAAFVGTEGLFREMYGKALPNYQIEASTHLFHRYELFGNIDWLSKDGETVRSRKELKSNITLANASLGLKFLFGVTKHLSGYLGGGLNAGYFEIEKLNGPHKHKKKSKGSPGFVLKSGLVLPISRIAYINYFIDYLFQPTDFVRHHNLGGLKFGAGIGYRF